MSEEKEVRDCVGNSLKQGDLVTVCFKTIPIFKIIAVESGGLHTPKGRSPARIRIVCDMTLAQMPEFPFESLVRITSPSSQQIVESIANSLPRG